MEYNTTEIEIPTYIKDYISLQFEYPINLEEKQSVTAALSMISMQLRTDNIQPLRKVVCIFTKDGDYHFRFKSLDQISDYQSFCIFGVECWRRQKYDVSQILVEIIERLCRHFWNIENSGYLYYKVYNIMKLVKPDLKFDELYNINSNTNKNK